jgi:type II secretory pathway pseudopilin PulG
MINTKIKIHAVKRRFISLIELLIVITILSLVAGVVGIQIHKTLREQRFTTEAALVLDKLRLAQELMLILRTDAHVKFKQEPGQEAITLWVEVETPLQSLKKDVQKPLELKTIQFVEFKDELVYETKMGEIDIKFLSGGNLMSKGVVRLSTSETTKDRGALERFIALPGYPKSLQMTIKKEGEVATAAFDDRLTAITQQELQDVGIFKP